MKNEQSASATAVPTATPQAPVTKRKPRAKKATSKGKPTAKRGPGRPKGSKNKAAKRGPRKTARRGRSDVTVEQLQRELTRKQARLERIKARQRESLVKQLAAIDAELAAVGDAQAGGRRRSAGGRKTAGGRRKSGATLTDAIAKVLARRSKGMSVKDVAAAVVQAGYKSSSKNLYPMVSQALRDKRFKKVARGVYAMK